MMASRTPDFRRASALPLSAVLGAIASYPRPVIERLVASLIDHLDDEDAPSEDLEAEDPAEDDDPGGGNVEDEGEHDNRTAPAPTYDTDQRVILGRYGFEGWRDT